MRSLNQEEVTQLESQGCRSDDWSSVTIDGDTDLNRIERVEFVGTVSVGPNRGSVMVDGLPRPCGLYDATIAHSIVGADVRIANVGTSVSRYRIGNGSVIEDVGCLVADEGASFGWGTEARTVNEAGGRTVVLYPELSAQVSFLQTFRLHDNKMQSALRALIARSIDQNKPATGIVGDGAMIIHSGTVRNVCVGDAALIEGAARLENGSVLSSSDHPTVIGADVHAKDFIIAEGAHLDGGVTIDAVYVGQATRLAKQYSAENSLFFANCEGFHGEAVSVSAGPYTVSHHKSTLLIAAHFSFFNAGSGTNQSNHMYKLGPVHQGVFERGCKTGSSSYVPHETHVGAYSVVIGAHNVHIDAGDLPFSLIYESGGRSWIVPGKNLFSVGTMRDGEKWTSRDRRTAKEKRDHITFDIISPYTVEKMRRGRNRISSIEQKIPKGQETVEVGGATMRRPLLQRSLMFYGQAIDMYLGRKVLDRLHETLRNGSSWKTAVASLKGALGLKAPAEWVDVGGLLMPREDLTAIEQRITAGTFTVVSDVQEAFRETAGRYGRAEWEYVCHAFREEHGFFPHEMTPERARIVLDRYEEAAKATFDMIRADLDKEFDSSSQIGYGIGMEENDRRRDFESVRGSRDAHPVLSKILDEQKKLTMFLDELRNALEKP